jgi:hypothetical protein
LGVVLRALAVVARANDARPTVASADERAEAVKGADRQVLVLRGS